MPLGLFAQGEGLVTVQRKVALMGGEVEITVVAQNEEIGYTNIEEAIAEMRRIEKLISSWDPGSETSAINRQAGEQAVTVSRELFRLLERCVQLSELTGGAFDVTFGNLSDLWAFHGPQRYLPTPRKIRSALFLSGYRKLRMDAVKSTVYLPERGMKIGFGAIGKGYAVERAKALLMSKDVPGGMINAGGDICSWGSRSTGEKWLIGIDDPLRPGRILNWVPLDEHAVSISGLQERYLLVNGEKYRDIIDPRKGEPVRGINRVTVFSPSAELADALATALFIMGPEQGLGLVNQLKGTEAIIEDDRGLLHQSLGMPAFLH